MPSKGFNPVRGAWGDNSVVIPASATGTGTRAPQLIGKPAGKMTATPFIGNS
jgi:hypothetical protein